VALFSVAGLLNGCFVNEKDFRRTRIEREEPGKRESAQRFLLLYSVRDATAAFEAFWT